MRGCDDIANLFLVRHFMGTIYVSHCARNFEDDNNNCLRKRLFHSTSFILSVTLSTFISHILYLYHKGGLLRLRFLAFMDLSETMKTVSN